MVGQDGSPKKSGFNFLKSLKGRMQKLSGDPVKKYAATWELLKDAIEMRGGGSPGRGVTSKVTADIKGHLKTMLGLLVEEAKKGDSELTGAAPPCYEYMMKKNILKQLCGYAKWQHFDILLLHHITDVVLFVTPLLGHFKQATAPLLDLLAHTETKLQLWVKNASSKSNTYDHHTRCLSHGFIQLVYSIAWQLQCSQTVVECVDFFFVDKTRFEFDEKEIHPTRKNASFILLEFVIPYLKRTEEVVASSEIDYVDDLLAVTGSEAHEIYTTEVAIDALNCVFGLQSENVASYLESMGTFIAVLITQNISKLCKELLDKEHCDEYATRELLMEQLQRRIQLLDTVALHPKEGLKEAFRVEYRRHVVDMIFVERLTTETGVVDQEHVLQLASFILENLKMRPFCDEMLDGLFSAPLKPLLSAILRNDATLVPSVLNLFLIMFKVRPNKAASVLLTRAIAKCAPLDDAENFDTPTLAEIDGLFHPLLFLHTDGDGDAKTRQDQHNTQLHIQSLSALEKGLSALECPMAWDETAGADMIPPMTPVSEKSECFLELIFQRCATIFDQPIDVTLLLLDLITTLAHLNNRKLFYVLLKMRSDRMLTLTQSLLSLKKVIGSWVEKYGEPTFLGKVEGIRRSLGIIPSEGGYEVERDEETQLFEAALLLEEWRRELRETVNVLQECTICAEMSTAVACEDQHEDPRAANAEDDEYRY